MQTSELNSVNHQYSARVARPRNVAYFLRQRTTDSLKSSLYGQANTFKIYATAQDHTTKPQPLLSFTPDNLFRAVKKELDPDGLFRTPVFEGEKK